MRALVSHLGVPVPQICVGYLARHVENHDADVRSEVVCGVKLVKRLLTGCIPDICTPSNAKLSERFDMIKGLTIPVRRLQSMITSLTALTHFVCLVVNSIVVPEHGQCVRR